MIQNTFKTCVVGIDISDEETIFAIVDIRGNIIAQDSFQTLDYANINDFIAKLSDSIIMLAEANGGYENIRSIGISTPSGNYLTGCIEHSPRLPWGGRIPLAAMMRDRMGLATAVANDAHVRALGEAAFGCAHGMKTFIVVVIGYGVGGCLVSNGQVHLGSNGHAGEVGHTCIILNNGRPCACGRKGCLEAYCSNNGILTTVQEVLAESNAPSLMRGCEKLTPKTIEEFCNQGDELSIEVYKRTGKFLGLGLANYASIANPEAFILTGGISKAGKWLLEPANEAFEENVFHNTRNKVKLLTSTLVDSERDVLGASVLAWSVKEYSLFK
jgi:glucokinase